MVQHFVSTTCGLPNRLRDRAAVKANLHLIEGSNHADVKIFDHAGTHLCNGFIRLLFGDHGPYFEVDRESVEWSSFKAGKELLHYDEYHSVGAKAQLYDQKKTVAAQPNPPRGPHSARNNRSEGYADYRPKFCYISCWSVRVNAQTTDLTMGDGRLRGRIQRWDAETGVGCIAPRDEAGGGALRGDGVVPFDLTALRAGSDATSFAAGKEVAYTLVRTGGSDTCARKQSVALVAAAAAPKAGTKTKLKRKRGGGAANHLGGAAVDAAAAAVAAIGAGAGADAIAPKQARRREGRGVAPRLSLVALLKQKPGDAGAAERALILRMFAAKALKRVAERAKRWYRSAHTRAAELNKAQSLEARSVAGAPSWLHSVRRGAVVAPLDYVPIGGDGGEEWLAPLAAALAEHVAAVTCGGARVAVVDCNPAPEMVGFTALLVAALGERDRVATLLQGAGGAALDALLDTDGDTSPICALICAGSDRARGFAQRSARATAMRRLRAAPTVTSLLYVAHIVEDATGETELNGLDNLVEEVVALSGPLAAARRARPNATEAAAEEAVDGDGDDEAAAAEKAAEKAEAEAEAAKDVSFVPVCGTLLDASLPCEARCTLALRCVRATASEAALFATAAGRTYCWTCGASAGSSPCDPDSRTCATREAWRSVA